MSEVLFNKASAVYSGPFGPLETDDARHLIGQNILCANRKESLGEYAILRSIEKNNYVVESCVNNKIIHRLWIVGYE